MSLICSRSSRWSLRGGVGADISAVKTYRPQRPVDIASSELGYVKISHGRDEIEVYVEITRVFVTDDASDADGNPCVTAVWRHGIRVCPRG